MCDNDHATMKQYMNHTANKWTAKVSFTNIVLTSSRIWYLLPSDNVIHHVTEMNHKTFHHLDSFLNDRDTLLMKILMNYFQLLYAEKDIYMKQLETESVAYNIKRNNCQIDREIRVSYLAILKCPSFMMLHCDRYSQQQQGKNLVILSNLCLSPETLSSINDVGMLSEIIHLLIFLTVRISKELKFLTLWISSTIF
jgi:hypothetical protein